MTMQSAHAQMVKILEMAKETHWLENKSLPSDEIQRRWAMKSAPLSAVLGVGAPVPVDLNPAAETPTTPQSARTTAWPTMTSKTGKSLERTCTDNEIHPSTTQLQSKTQPPVRKRASPSGPGPFTNTETAVPPLTLNTWQLDHDEPFNYLSPSSSPPAFKTRRTATGRLPTHSPEYSSIAVYDPADYVKQSQSTLSPTSPNYVGSRRNSSQNLSPMSAHTRSPGTLSASDELTNPTDLSSVGMSRSDSLGGSSFYGGFTMLKVDSRRSETSPKADGDAESSPETMNPLDTSMSMPVPAVDAANLSLSVSHAAGGTGRNFSSSSFASAPNYLDLGPLSGQGFAMSRTASSESVDSTKSRISRRSQEQAALGTRPIAPKDHTESMSRQASSSSSSEIDMTRQLSADGSKVAIQKAKYQRPTHEKIKCDLCSLKPDGFRGPHELRRHMDNKHGATRKVWVCKDLSPDQMFLSKCKQCREKKTYGAYYNAACHLRRIHWNPREKGKKADKSTKGRGGNGGGDYPSMNHLKLWMEEISVPVTKGIPFPEQDQDEDDSSSDLGVDVLQDDYRYQTYDDAVLPHNPVSAPAVNTNRNTNDSALRELSSTADGYAITQTTFSASDSVPSFLSSHEFGIPFTFENDGSAGDSVLPAFPHATSNAPCSDRNISATVSANPSLATGSAERADLFFTSGMNSSLHHFDQSTPFSFDSELADFAL